MKKTLILIVTIFISLLVIPFTKVIADTVEKPNQIYETNGYSDYSYIRFETEVGEVIGSATKTLGGFNDLPLIVITGYLVKTSKGLQIIEHEQTEDSQPEYLELLWNPDSCSYEVSTAKIKVKKN